MPDPRDAGHTIAVEVRDLAQLYDSLDPAPFHDKALDPKFEDWLVDSAREHAPGTPLTIALHAPAALASHEPGIEAAIRRHFEYALQAALRRDRHRVRAGHAALVIGLVVLAVTLALRSALPVTGATLVEATREGLLILGWVALWRPVDILLFERWELHNERRYLRALAEARVRFEHEKGDAKMGTEVINES